MCGRSWARVSGGLHASRGRAAARWGVGAWRFGRAFSDHHAGGLAPCAATPNREPADGTGATFARLGMRRAACGEQSLARTSSPQPAVPGRSEPTQTVEATASDAHFSLRSAALTPRCLTFNVRRMRASFPNCMKRRIFITALFAACLPLTTHAEVWPPLDDYVDSCVLIVQCKSERYKDGLRYKVTEVWKGVYTPELFYGEPEEGYLYANGWHGNTSGTEGAQTIFFFTPYSPKWAGGKLVGHSTAFPIADGKLIYAATGNPGEPKEFTLDEFRAVITKRVRSTYASEVRKKILQEK